MSKLLTTEQAADILELKPQTLRTWRIKPNNPLPYLKISGAVRYDPEDVEKLKSRSRRTCTLDPPAG